MSLLLLVPVGAGARWDPVRRAVSTGVVVGHRAVPCWPFPNQRGGTHASLARPVTKMPARSNQKWANWPKWVRKYGGVFQPNWRHLRLVPPSFKPKRISSLLCRPGPTLGTPRFGPRPWSLECWHELTVSNFPQGFTFLRLFFALRVHPLFGMETTPLSRLCPGSQRDWLDWSPCVTDSSARAEIQGLRSIYGDGRTVCRFGIGCQ